MHNALTYDFDQLTPDSAVVELAWEKVAVPFKVAVDVHSVVRDSLKKQLRDLPQYTWISWDDAANYLLAEKVAPFAEYHRFVARDAVRKQLPIRPGGLPLIQDRLAELVPSSFSPPIDEGRLFAEPRTPSAFPAPTVAQG